jgi:hypothetical protein
MTKGGIRLEVLLNATTRKDEQGNIIGKRLHRSAIFERSPIYWNGLLIVILFKGVVGIGQDVSIIVNIPKFKCTEICFSLTPYLS